MHDFILTIEQGKSYRLMAEAGELLIPSIILFDPLGCGLTTNSVLRPSGAVLEVSWTARMSGDFLLRFTDFGFGGGQYSLELSEVDANQADDHMGAPCSASAIFDEVRGAVEVGSDSDWFALEAQAGTLYEVSLDPSSLEILISARLFGPDLQLLAIGPYNFAFTPSESGTYYIEVTSVIGDTGEYTLTLATP